MNPTNDIRDIKGLVPLPPEWWVWLLVAFVAVSVAIIAWVIWRKHVGARPAMQVPPPSLTPRMVALAELTQLKADNPPVEIFYTRLSGIIRQFIEGQFGLRAPERTTEEFLAEAKLPAEQMGLLGAFLQEADLVKFARLQPGAADRDRAFAAAEKFVRESAQ